MGLYKDILLRTVTETAGQALGLTFLGSSGAQLAPKSIRTLGDDSEGAPASARCFHVIVK